MSNFMSYASRGQSSRPAPLNIGISGDEFERVRLTLRRANEVMHAQAAYFRSTKTARRHKPSAKDKFAQHGHRALHIPRKEGERAQAGRTWQEAARAGEEIIDLRTPSTGSSSDCSTSEGDIYPIRSTLNASQAAAPTQAHSNYYTLPEAPVQAYLPLPSEQHQATITDTHHTILERYSDDTGYFAQVYGSLPDNYVQSCEPIHAGAALDPFQPNEYARLWNYDWHTNRCDGVNVLYGTDTYGFQAQISPKSQAYHSSWQASLTLLPSRYNDSSDGSTASSSDASDFSDLSIRSFAVHEPQTVRDVRSINGISSPSINRQRHTVERRALQHEARHDPISRKGRRYELPSQDLRRQCYYELELPRWQSPASRPYAADYHGMQHQARAGMSEWQRHTSQNSTIAS